jgi:ATP-dependent Zn protease
MLPTTACDARAQLDELVALLLKNETVDSEQVTQLFGRRRTMEAAR